MPGVLDPVLAAGVGLGVVGDDGAQRGDDLGLDGGGEQGDGLGAAGVAVGRGEASADSGGRPPST